MNEGVCFFLIPFTVRFLLFALHMKSKTRITFVCQECGYDTPKFMGKCPECGMWNTLKQLSVISNQSLGKRNAGGIVESGDKPVKLGEVVFKNSQRIQTNLSELNTVLGGGLVLGSATLIAGDPGVGKSTLLLQLCLSLSELNKKVLYITGEESVEQIKMRADRLAGTKVHRYKGTENKILTDNTAKENLLLLATSDPDYGIEQIEAVKPDIVVLDSVQTMQSQNLEGLSGSVGQVRYTAMQFIRSAKKNNIPTLIVGHVTKEGMVAGPMVLSHMVDTVLFLEGEKFTPIRILRSLKNRFGPVDEVGIFSMNESGMNEVQNPEELFLTHSQDVSPGSVLVATLEGSRTFLVELQALAVSSKLAMPRRVVSGLDRGRVELLLAVLQKHARLPVDQMDIFVNVAGGMKLSDPGVDLGICLAIFSSLKNIPLSRTVGIAEVGLLGELRSVSGLDRRVNTSAKLGYNKVITAKTHKNIREVIGSFDKR